MSEQADPLLSPPYGRGLHGGVVTTLGRQIVGGAFQPGDVLNMERLEEDLSVSRSVLREAVRVLVRRACLRHAQSAAPLCVLRPNGTCWIPTSWCGRSQRRRRAIPAELGGCQADHRTASCATCHDTANREGLGGDASCSREASRGVGSSSPEDR